MFERIEKFLKEYYGLLFVILTGVILVLLPFIYSNNLESYDFVGHYANSYYIKNFFWPWPDGWNSMVLSGFSQGLLYPSAFHWLVAAAGFVMPLTWSFKLWVSISIIAFPVLTYLTSRRLFKNKMAASFAFIVISIIYYFRMGVNDNLYADIFFGMANHLFSLSLFMGYLYFLVGLVKKKNNWIWPSIFLALSLLFHAFTGLAAILFGLILWILAWKDLYLRKNIFWHFVFAALLSTWWWLPMLVNISYMSGNDITSVPAGLISFFMPLIFVLGVYVYKLKDKHQHLFKAIVIFSGLVIIAMLISLYIFRFNYLPLHFSRFLIYVLIFVPILLTQFMTKYKINWVTTHCIALICFCFYVLLFRIIPVGPFTTQVLDNTGDYWRGGRTIFTGTSEYLDNRFHGPRFFLPLEHNMPIFGGLFVESSPNGWFIMSAMHSWGEDSAFIWGYNDLKDTASLKWASNIFGINYEYHISDTSPDQEEWYTKNSLISGYNYEDQTPINLFFKSQRQRVLDNTSFINMLGEVQGFYYQSLYKIGDNSLAETLDETPINVFDDWDETTKEWWSTDWLKEENGLDYKKPMLVYQADNLSDWQVSDEKINLDLVTQPDRMDQFTVDASSLDQVRPIYVKMGYFPWWHAFDEQGKELKIYKASPNFMLVNGQGMINFVYIKPWYYYGAFILSGISLLFVLLFRIFVKKK